MGAKYLCATANNGRVFGEWLIAGGYKVTTGSRDRVVIAGVLCLLSLTTAAGTAQAQATDDFDVSATTNAAAGITCGQNLSFGRAYVSGSNAQASVSVSGFGTLNSNHASVVVTGATLGQCTLSGLQGGDTASLTLSGGSGTPGTGGLTGVILSDGSSHTLTAAVLVGIGGGGAISGGRTGLSNGVIPVFGTVVIPASHVDLGTYSATLTVTAALD